MPLVSLSNNRWNIQSKTFSHHLRHPARKRSGCIPSNPEPAWDTCSTERPSGLPLFALQCDGVLMTLIAPDQQLLLHGVDVFLQEVEYLAERPDTASERLDGRSESVDVTLGYVALLAARRVHHRLRTILHRSRQRHDVNVRCASGCVVQCWICNREVAGSNLGRGYFAPRSTQSYPSGVGK